jgi:hypothetical protein
VQSVATLCFVCVQVHDYYVGLKFNDLSVSIKHLYRLFIASCMLRAIKVKRTGMAHNYPLMMLANLLILDYWRHNRHVAIMMMRHHMCIVNEEMGEITFGMLARLVLGDSLKSDFEHMHKMYSLIPAFRAVKQDVRADSDRKTSLNWKHKIAPDDHTVVLVGVHFKRVIRNILNGTYRSYDGTPACYKSAAASAEHLTSDFSAPVYDPDISSALPGMFKLIQTRLDGSFLEPVSDIWPEGKSDAEVSQSDEDLESAEDLEQEPASDGEQEWGAEWKECVIGHYAVGRVDLGDDGPGIEVYKILSKQGSESKAEAGVARSFEGTKYTSRIAKNNDHHCLKGPWDVSQDREQVLDWSVIVYFHKLLRSGKLPVSAVQVIQEQCADNQIFQENQPLFE